MTYCSNCGFQLKGVEKFSPSCGNKQSLELTPTFNSNEESPAISNTLLTGSILS